MRKTPLHQGKKQPLKKHVAGGAAASVKACSGGSCSPDTASSTGSVSTDSRSKSWNIGRLPYTATSTGPVSTDSRSRSWNIGRLPYTASSSSSVSTGSVPALHIHQDRDDADSSTGFVLASVYIQMLSQQYLSLKCFQDFKAIHVSIHHCHTPLLLLES